MKEEDDNILEKAIEAIRNEQIPQGPPQELVDTTVTRLNEAQSQSDTASSVSVTGLFGRIKAFRYIARYAAAAVLLIVAGYAVGRLSAARPPDVEELQTVLEPAIRRNVVAQLRNDLQAGLATCYDRLSDELGRQHSQEMARFAAQTLDASNSVTTELLTAVVESINATQTEERQLLVAILEQMELERMRESEALASFAVRTEDTLQGIAQFLSYGMPGGPATREFGNSDNPDERTDK
ncbi:MAG: hypothetical protein JSW59_17510 [Phycisphaerales bacterium]|nr:MAG: hypothetical protein JSW59_17510 [Phycisphaerales bacterium]